MSGPIHVVHVVASFDVGGLQNGIVNLINRSDPSRLRHTVVSLSPAIGMAERLTRGDVTSIGFGEGRRLFAYRALASSLARLRADIVHTRNWAAWPDGVLAARRARVPVRIHGYHGRDLANAAGERPRRRLIGRFLSLITHRFVTLTPTMRREFARDFHVSQSAIEVIPNGVDLDRIDGVEPSERTRSSFTVLTVGRLDAVKNVPLLVRGFARMPGREKSDRLMIVGEGAERSVIESAARAEGVADSVEFLGSRDDVAALMKGADVYVQPSFYEGMSNTIVEAMTCSLPVICTDVGGNADVVGRDGAAILIPSDDAPALAAALGNLRADSEERGRLARVGRDHVVAHYALELMVEAYTELYERTASRGTAPRKPAEV